MRIDNDLHRSIFVSSNASLTGGHVSVMSEIGQIVVISMPMPCKLIGSQHQFEQFKNVAK